MQLSQHIAGAQQVAVIVTDGPPMSATYANTEIQRLKSAGVRIQLVSIGTGVGRRSLKEWPSWPEKDNVMLAQSYNSLPSVAKVIHAEEATQI